MPAAAAPNAADARLSITWIGHSTFLIQSAGSSVLTDPIWSDRASPVQFAGPRRHSPPGLSFDALPATGLHPEFGKIARRFGPLHVAILPIGAYEPRWFMRPVHMNPEDATEAYVRISETDGSTECVFVPSHWGTFRLTDEPLDEPPQHLLNAWTTARLPTSRLRQLSPGETLTLS
ncbi:MAG: MBL fold metallo-hydrolase [Gemmatimonadota bacterium]|nr:MBL fold metallo-hydrolase [Gemmatimonadota bacterium]